MLSVRVGKSSDIEIGDPRTRDEFRLARAYQVLGGVPPERVSLASLTLCTECGRIGLTHTGIVNHPHLQWLLQACRPALGGSWYCLRLANEQTFNVGAIIEDAMRAIVDVSG